MPKVKLKKSEDRPVESRDCRLVVAESRDKPSPDSFQLLRPQQSLISDF